MPNLDQIFFAQNNVDINNVYKIGNNALSNSDGGELFLEFCQLESLVFDDTAKLMKDIMENAIEISIPLEVEIKVGDNWALNYDLNIVDSKSINHLN